MARRYEELKPARFRTEFVDGAQQIVIPARRNWFVILFLGFWISLWTVGGVAALYQVTQTFDLFLIFWLCGWAVGWLFAAATIAWQLSGREILRVIGGDLEVRQTAIGLSRSWWFRGADMQCLQTGDKPAFPFGWGHFDAPLMFWRRWGAAKFRYGARTVYLAPSLDEAEGELIVKELEKYLPRAITSQ